MSSTNEPPSGTLFDHAPDDPGPGHCPACRQPRDPLFPTTKKTHHGPWAALCARCWSEHHRPTGKQRSTPVESDQESLW
ncbi:hypothetical protein PUR71_33265 [Streptomyces sp. SP17BM10]|uniref:hypothetical protein n=1 Tax=Streptomyces sp. SP17BM10 TaxID=3002530 RepID=UPI002E78A15E|nr:hypothetical protein [Streptomyces sp. SP17BM10]MEE1787742.1 hypothetical protein [Streptomyces sp. SP17BM10]